MEVLECLFKSYLLVIPIRQSPTRRWNKMVFSVDSFVGLDLNRLHTSNVYSKYIMYTHYSVLHLCFLTWHFKRLTTVPIKLYPFLCSSLFYQYGRMNNWIHLWLLFAHMHIHRNSFEFNYDLENSRTWSTFIDVIYSISADVYVQPWNIWIDF